MTACGGTYQVVGAGLNSVAAYSYGRLEFNMKFENNVGIPFVISWQSDAYRVGYAGWIVS